jgi:hypothetical protein
VRRPNQTDWFSESTCQSPRLPPCAGFETWDYDCSGASDKRYPSLAAPFCTPINLIFCGGDGWETSPVPDCESEAAWVECAGDGRGGCSSRIRTQQQLCR